MSTKIKAISKLKIKATKAKLAVNKVEHDKCRAECKRLNPFGGREKMHCENDCRNAFFRKKHQIEGKYVDHPVYGRLRY